VTDSSWSVKRVRRKSAAAAARGSLWLASGIMEGLGRGLRLLPPGSRYLPADGLAAGLKPLLRKQRRQAEANYAIMLDLPSDHPRVRGLARQSLRNYARMATDFLRVRTMTRDQVLAWGRPMGEDYFAAALAEGRGVIFALAHCGSWDVAAAYALAYGVKLTIVTEDSWTSRLVASSRQGFGVTLAPRQSALRLTFKALARNEVVAIIADLVEKGFQTVTVPFFGKPAPFPVGPARLAHRTGAAVMVCSGFRMADGSYRIEGQTPLHIDRSLPEAQAVATLTAQIAARFEALIGAHPEQWYPYRPVWPGVEVPASRDLRAALEASPPT